MVLMGVLTQLGRLQGHESDRITAFESQVHSTVQRVIPACVAVTESRAGGFGSFSGVIVSKDGIVLSAAHAVKPGGQYTVHLHDGRSFHAKALGANRKIDCAMLKISEPVTLQFAEMGSSSSLRKDQYLFSVSHPGVFRRDRGAVVRFGRVVRPITAPLGMIQSTVLMEPGDSGGPLFDLTGRVVGIRSQIQRSLDENYDVAIDSFRACWDQLQNAEEFQVASIPGLPDPGFTARRSRRGVTRVVSVATDGPAAMAGLEEDDIIVSVRGQNSDSPWNIIVEGYYEGVREFPMVVQRNGTSETLTLEFKEANTARADYIPSVALLSEAESQVVPLPYRDWKFSYSVLEDRLDDSCVTIESLVFDELSYVMGTIVGDGWVLSKSSCVGDDVRMTLIDRTIVSGEVVKRDKENDLVLIRVRDSISKGIEFGKSTKTMLPREMGRVLVTPDPRGEGWVSVVSSCEYRSPKDSGRGYLGVELSQTENAVVIANLVRGGAAQKAGLLEGDTIMKVNEVDVKSIRDLQGYLRGTVPNEKITIVYERNGEKKEEKIRVGEVVNNPSHVAEYFDGGKSSRRDGFPLVSCHDAPIRPEQCGGPVFDSDGHFLGINIARYSRTQTHVIPEATVRRFVESARMELSGNKSQN